MSNFSRYSKAIAAFNLKVCGRETKRRLQRNYQIILAWIILILSLTTVYISFSTEKLPIRDLFNSDTFYLPTLYQDLFYTSYNVSGWKLPAATYFFPDMLIFFFIASLASDFRLAIVFYGIIQSILFVLSLIHLSKNVFGPRQIVHLIVLLVGAVFFALLSTGKYNFFLDTQKSVHHFGATLVTIVSLSLVAQIIGCGSDYRRAVLYCMMLFPLSTLTVASDMLYIIQFLIPMI